MAQQVLKRIGLYATREEYEADMEHLMPPYIACIGFENKFDVIYSSDPIVSDSSIGENGEFSQRVKKLETEKVYLTVSQYDKMIDTIAKKIEEDPSYSPDEDKETVYEMTDTDGATTTFQCYSSKKLYFTYEPEEKAPVKK